jgi:predicted GIY-YIG superfamily endonuclease
MRTSDNKYYVFILCCEHESDNNIFPFNMSGDWVTYYTELTSSINIDDLLDKHNNGQVEETKDRLPVVLEEIKQFDKMEEALNFKSMLENSSVINIQKEIGKIRRKRLRDEYVFNP